MEVSDNYRISLSLEELNTIVKERIVQFLRDTERPMIDPGLIYIEYQIDHNEEGSELNGADININLPWEKEEL